MSDERCHFVFVVPSSHSRKCNDARCLELCAPCETLSLLNVVSPLRPHPSDPSSLDLQDPQRCPPLLASARDASQATISPAPQLYMCIPRPQPLLPTTQFRSCAKAPSARARDGYGPRPVGVADAARASPPPRPHGSLVHAHVNCSRWRLPCVQPPRLDMLLHRLHRDRRLLRVHRDRRLASRAVARGGYRRRAAAANEPAATFGDAGREASHACDAARPSGSRAEVLCQKRERHLRTGAPWLVSPADAQGEMWRETKRAPGGGAPGSTSARGPCRVHRR